MISLIYILLYYYFRCQVLVDQEDDQEDLKEMVRLHPLLQVQSRATLLTAQLNLLAHHLHHVVIQPFLLVL